jgi:hypothetical protein
MITGEGAFKMDKEKKRGASPPVPESKTVRPAIYHRFEEKDLPPGLKPWPQGLDVPSFGQMTQEVPGLSGGLYFKCWPGGQLQTVINVESGKIVECLGLEDGTADGFWQAGVWAQKYYRNGQKEDFHPWADNDPAYPAEVTFEEWVSSFIGGMKKYLERGRPWE